MLSGAYLKIRSQEEEFSILDLNTSVKIFAILSESAFLDKIEKIESCAGQYSDN